ncbi:NAD(P)-dependent oxidoreductase [Betaproteobacteria bacterium PRO7]|jgi:citronellol/citronellal dehydrogenase|nr:NAD(P)-dependent oxidoreductase [Burkholderiaceae bacterium]MDL1861687.1 NAD(P)-dependent oxidoreductase [Betaproteobacteria bacterium PRO7]
MNLKGKTIFISGASRGIGLAIVKRAAADGANVAIAAKTTEPNPKLPGTIYTAAEEVEAAGGKALPIQCDIRDEAQVVAAAKRTADHFGGIDILVNNASAINLTPTEATPMKRFDLMFGVNVRGTFLCTQACLPYLKKSAERKRNPHVLTLSPPLNLDARWFAPHVAYTMAKYGMSMCVLGHAEEFRSYGIAVNALWPRTVIQTAALQMIPGVQPEHCRTPQIMADAAYAILTREAAATTGNFFIDEEVLKQAGVADFDRYSVVPGSKQLLPDLFL